MKTACTIGEKVIWDWAKTISLFQNKSIDFFEEDILPGDAILLCSDGLTRELSESRIATILRANRAAQETADILVDLANQAAGRDNISVVVISNIASQSSQHNQDTQSIPG